MPLPALSPPEEKLLRTLWSRGALTRGQARADADTVSRLVAVSFIVELPAANKRTKPKLALTEAGRAAASRLPPVKPSQLDVFRQVAAMRQELETLREMVTAHWKQAEPQQRAKEERQADERAQYDESRDGPAELDRFGERVLSAVASLDKQERLGGLVPLPRVRVALADLGMSRDAFDDAMVALEEQYVIDMKIANDPSRLHDRDAGIEMPNRGLLYFVVAR